MSSNEKLFNKELLFSILRNAGWLGFLYQILLLAAVFVPFVQQNAINKGAVTLDVHSSIFYAAPAFQTFTLVFIPVILGIFLFSYLMKERTSVFTHSMPFSRKSLYLHHTLSGIVILILPIIITAFLTMLVVSNSSLPATVIDDYVFSEWAIIACSAALGMFSLSTLAAMISGNFVAQGAIAFGILLAPKIIYGGITDTIERLFYGFQFDIIYIESVQNAVYQFSKVAILVSVVILVLAYFIYLKRDIANTSESIVFRRLKPIFKYVFTIFALFATAIVTTNYATTVVQFFVILIIGTFIGYVIAELIIKKSRLSFKNFIGFFVFAGIFTVLFVGLCYMSSKYVATVPDVDDISSVTIAPYYIHDFEDENLEEELYESLTLTEEASFETVTRVHEKLIFLKPEKFDPMGNYPDVTITYSLENGDQMSRTYSSNLTNSSGSRNITVLQELLSIPELINNVCEFLDVTVRNSADHINIYGKPLVSASNEDAFNGLIDALILDIQSLGLSSKYYLYEYSSTEPVSYSIGFDNDPEGDSVVADIFVITEDYENTINWLEENGYNDVALSLTPTN